jgi:uncharacterized damage-inducible protein DinB
MQQVKWFERKFNFSSEQNTFPSIIERLWGTPLRLEAKMQNIDAAILELKIDNTWSIKENIGHLIDLESLWQGRLEDIINGEEELRPTDLQNSQVERGNYNALTLQDLLAQFRAIRQVTLDKLAAIDEATVFKYALHPRLKTPMRTIDLFLFVAEHDDHHLARITEIARSCAVRLG